MRLDKVYIDGFKNLKQLEVDFDETKLTTVLIGQNGAGKSNLIEAITQVFRWVDLRKHEPRFLYRVDYRISGASVTLSNVPKEPAIKVDGKAVKRTEFEKRKTDWFPDLVFGYYSGGSRRLESLFDDHQKRYYDAIKLEENVAAFTQAQGERRLFYCRPIHGVMALMTCCCWSRSTRAAMRAANPPPPSHPRPPPASPMWRPLRRPRRCLLWPTPSAPRARGQTSRLPSCW